jgi:hypothetical protein
MALILLFRDEPTSGLDATASLNIISSLAQLSNSGMMIAAVIHQPRFSLFEKFDNVLLLGGGRTIYSGHSKEALDYFEKSLGLECPGRENPADFFLDITSEKGSELADKWEEFESKKAVIANAEEEKLENEPRRKASRSIDEYHTVVTRDKDPDDLLAVQKKDTPTVFQQFLLQLARSLRQLLYGFWEVSIEILIHLIAGLAVGCVYGTSWDLARFPLLGCLSGLAIGIASVATSLRILSRDRLFFWRESSVGVSIAAFFYAKVIIQLYQVLVLPLIFTSVFRALIFPEIDFFAFYAVYCMIAWYTSAIGMFISVVMEQSSMLTSIIIAMILGGFFSGTYPYLNDLSGVLKAITYVSFTRWAAEALTILEDEGLPAHIDKSVLYINGFNHDNFLLDIAMLLVLGIFFRLATLAALRFKRRNFNWIQWLDELRVWIAMPLGFFGLVASGVLFIMDKTSLMFKLSPLVFVSLSYLVLMGSIHYYSLKFPNANSPSTITLLHVNRAVKSHFWVLFQALGDFFLFIASILVITAVTKTSSVSWTLIGCFIAVFGIVKSLGVVALIRFRIKRFKTRRQLVAYATYPLWLATGSVSVLILARKMDLNELDSVPFVAATFPFFALLVKIIWGCFRNWGWCTKFFVLLPLFLAELCAFVQYDCGVQSSSLEWTIMGLLLLYPLAIALIVLVVGYHVLTTFVAFCCNGCTSNTIKRFL